MYSNESEGMSHKANWNVENFNIVSDWMDSSHVTWFNSMFDKFKVAINNNDFRNSEITDAYFCIQAIMKAYESIENNSEKININSDFPQLS
jgi:hypothetical protein